MTVAFYLGDEASMRERHATMRNSTRRLTEAVGGGADREILRGRKTVRDGKIQAVRRDVMIVGEGNRYYLRALLQAIVVAVHLPVPWVDLLADW